MRCHGNKVYLQHAVSVEVLRGKLDVEANTSVGKGGWREYKQGLRRHFRQALTGNVLVNAVNWAIRHYSGGSQPVQGEMGVKY